jgi:DNA-binding transcriptional regulator YiaG
MTSAQRVQPVAVAAPPYHYTACGLDNVYLMNGFAVEETDYGRGLRVDRLDELHRLIAAHLVTKRKNLSAREFRFLRRHMNLTQAELGATLGIDAQTVARYEKGDTAISGPADRLIRFHYVFSSLPRGEQLPMIDDIMALIEMDEPLTEPPARFAATEHGWRKAA